MPIDDIVDVPEEGDDVVKDENELSSWCYSRLESWESHRDTNYRTRWGQYERLWRGIWSESDKQKKSERSKYISPALSQAIESLVAEIEEATFATGRFFDIDPDFRDEQPEETVKLRDLLYNDMLTADIKTSISELILNGALYGTGIGKIVVESIQNKYITPKPVNGLPEVVETGLGEDEEVVIRLVPVSPKEFVIDNAAKNIVDALGMGHITIVPLHIIEERQREGIYDQINVSAYSGELDITEKPELDVGTGENHAKIYEYHGLVPAELLAMHILGDDFDELDFGDEESEEMAEAIVTISDGGGLLRAIPNPNTLQDRNFLAFQWDTLPNQFWGRGAAEKGYNAQVALDTEGRARQDGMALAIHPMMGVDANMMPRGTDLSVRAGRSILTNGDPSLALKPLNFGKLGTDTFQQTADLERQIAKATGALDDAAMNPSHAKTGAMGMAMSGAIKRSQRTLANVERNIMTPMVHKFAWRYMQYAPDKYPVVANPRFTVHTSQGIMAKEWETLQLGNMLKTVSPDSPAYWMLMKGVFENSSIKNREEFGEIIQGQLEAALNPQPSPQEQAAMQAQQAKLKIDMARARAELLRIEMDAQKLETGNLKTYTEAMLNIAKAEAEEAGVQVNEYTAVLGRIQAGLDVNLKKKAAESEAAQQQQQAAQPQQAQVAQ